MSDTEQEIAEQMDETSDTDDALEPDDDASGTDALVQENVAPLVDAPRTPADIEKVQQRLENEAIRHAKRVEEIMGADFALLVPSPVDWTPGFLFNAPGMLPPTEALDALDALVGRGNDADLLPAPDAQACETCNARGEGLTGSKKDGQRTKPCTDCSGTGWRQKLVAVPPMQDFSVNVQTPPPAATYNPGAAVADQWGRPFGHPHYGLNPAAVGA